MRVDRVFIGDIKKCTKYEEHNIFTSKTYIDGDCIDCDSFGHIKTESELYKKDAILLYVKDGGYVDLDNLKTLFDYIKVSNYITKDGCYFGGLIMTTSPYQCDSLFVDYDSIRPYKNKNNKETISARQLRKEFKR